MAKLTKDDRAQIVTMREKGVPYRDIAKRFGITTTWARQVAFVSGNGKAPKVKRRTTKLNTKAVAYQLACLLKARDEVKRLEHRFRTGLITHFGVEI